MDGPKKTRDSETRVTLNPILQRNMSTSNVKAGLNPSFFVDKKQNPIYMMEKKKDRKSVV